MNALISKIRQRWEARLEEWERLHVHVYGEAVVLEILADLRRISEIGGAEELTLSDAAQLSGYSTDHLSRLIRAGKLPNRGKKGAPRICRDELPMRPKTNLTNVRNREYDPITDARSLRVRR